MEFKLIFSFCVVCSEITQLIYRLHKSKILQHFKSTIFVWQLTNLFTIVWRYNGLYVNTGQTNELIIFSCKIVHTIILCLVLSIESLEICEILKCIAIVFNTFEKQCCYCSIRIRRLYNFDPFKPYVYIVKLGFTGVYIIFLIYARRGGSNEYPQSMFSAAI